MRIVAAGLWTMVIDFASTTVEKYTWCMLEEVGSLFAGQKFALKFFRQVTFGVCKHRNLGRTNSRLQSAATITAFSAVDQRCNVIVDGRKQIIHEIIVQGFQVVAERKVFVKPIVGHAPDDFEIGFNL